ncbi:hypothetical protein O987_16275 [Comamonas testosteroni TK102]|uniref:Uncharacterized protein n=1 Tax=Comamonas testosteroni TK102 TaxID=1392005 RepID=A0A076PUC1_COMTE|nr:hypothetical protein O987_16275 [Comamonas testosteroni TK102]
MVCEWAIAANTGAAQLRDAKQEPPRSEGIAPLRIAKQSERGGRRGAA